MRNLICIIALSVLFAGTARAEDINISAEEKVEWHQKENKMVAVGNAVASKKDLNIRADRMTAVYVNKDKSQKSGISSVNAVGNVVMKTPKATAYGSTLDYDVKKDIAILKGKPAKINTDKETITATEAITYYPAQQKAIATGDVVVSDKTNKLYSNRLIGYFNKNKSGALEIEKVEIFENVKIVTPDATVTALRGVYLPQNGLVRLYENVTINQDGNILKGDMAESDLNTGVSRLISNKKSGGRVSGVFKEKSNDKK